MSYSLTSFLLFFDRTHDPARFRRCLLPCAGLWLSTLHLRYPYFVDVLAGFALAAAVGVFLRKSAGAGRTADFPPGIVGREPAFPVPGAGGPPQGRQAE